MPKAKCQKFKEKQTADICICGITNSHEAFVDVSEKKFFSALAHLGLDIEKDSRLKGIKNIEMYYVPKEYLEELRTYGIWTQLVGYLHYKQYSVHYVIYQTIENILQEIDNYDLETIKKNLNIKELIPTQVKRYNVKKN